MHMGAMSVIGAKAPENLVHIVINNEAHESVGGMPTSAKCTGLPVVAEACGYRNVCTVKTADELDSALAKAVDSSVLTFIEVKAAIGARADLGRPASTPEQNKTAFTGHLRK